MMHPAERALLLDCGHRFLNANVEARGQRVAARSKAWDSVARRALFSAEIEAFDREIAAQRALIEAVEALPALEVVRG